MSDTKRSGAGADQPAYHRVFNVSVPPERVWRAFTDPAELEKWFTTGWHPDEDGDAAAAESPGGQVGFAVTEAVPNERLGYRQWAGDPSSGIDVAITFESDGGGTKITVTHAGFGDPSILQSPGVQHGMDETFDDLILYLEHGVVFPRHRDYSGRGDLGIQVKKVPGAIEVTGVTPGGLGDQVGMRPGDLLLRLGERGVVFDLDDLSFFLRSNDVGTEVEVGYARDGELREGRGTIQDATFDFAEVT